MTLAPWRQEAKEDVVEILTKYGTGNENNSLGALMLQNGAGTPLAMDRGASQNESFNHVFETLKGIKNLLDMVTQANVVADAINGQENIDIGRPHTINMWFEGFVIGLKQYPNDDGSLRYVLAYLMDQPGNFLPGIAANAIEKMETEINEALRAEEA